MQQAQALADHASTPRGAETKTTHSVGLGSLSEWVVGRATAVRLIGLTAVFIGTTKPILSCWTCPPMRGR